MPTTKKNQKNFKVFKSTCDPSKIRQIIDNAIKDKRRVWISYNGHLKPRIPRGISPIRWDEATLTSNKPRDIVFFAIPYKSQLGIAQKFFLRNVEEIRDGPWHVDVITESNNNNDSNNNNNNDKTNNKNDNKNNDNSGNNTDNIINDKLQHREAAFSHQDNTNFNVNRNNKPKNKSKKNHCQ